MALRHRREEEAIADALKATRGAAREANRPTGTEVRQTADVADAALDLAETVADDVGPVISPAVPKAPVSLAEVSNVGGFTAAGPVAVVTVSWSAVTESVDDEPVTVSEYEVWLDGAPVQRVTGVQAVVSVPSTLDAEVRVGAITASGVHGDLSVALNVAGASPSVASRAPSKPTLVTGYGNVSARWDGTYAGGGTVGAMSVWIEASLDELAWTRQGAALTGAGSTLVRVGAVDDEVFVRAVAYDQLGRETGVSETASIVIEAIDGEDILADSIEGNRIKAGTISVDHVEPNFGDAVNISGNLIITGIQDRADGQDATIGQLEENITNVSDVADAASSQAVSAQATANIASGQALVATSLAQGASQGVADLQAVIVMDATGITIGDQSWNSQLRLRPTHLAFAVGGVESSRMEAGRLITAEAILGQARVAQHEWKTHSPGRTTVTPIAT